MPSGYEFLIIGLIILLLFGAKKIPELARGLGQGINEFRKASSDIRREIEMGAEESDKPSGSSSSKSSASSPKKEEQTTERS